MPQFTQHCFQQLVESAFQLLLAFLGAGVIAVMTCDVTKDGEELLQIDGVALLKFTFLDSGENSIAEMILPLHGAALAGEGTVSHVQHGGCEQACCSHGV